MTIVSCKQHVKILRSLSRDIGDVASGVIQSTSLSAQEKACFMENHFVPGKKYEFATQILPKEGGIKQKVLNFQNSWLEQHKWLVYSPSQQGGFCKYCVLFPLTTSQIKTGVLVSIPIKKFDKATGSVVTWSCMSNSNIIKML